MRAKEVLRKPGFPRPRQDGPGTGPQGPGFLIGGRIQLGSFVLSPRTAVYALALALFFGQALLYLVYRTVNQDEGWYLWASRLVYDGRLPYRDFAYPQAPLLPYVYGLFRLILGPGLYQGRLISMGLALLGLLLGARISRRLAGPWAEAIYLLLHVTSLYAGAYHDAYVAPYALTSLLLLAGIYAALAAGEKWWGAPLAAACLVLAAGVRLSAAPALLPIGLYVWATAERKRRAGAIFFATALLTAGIAFGPFVLAASGVMWYDIFGFHTDRMPLAAQAGNAARAFLETATDFAVPLASVVLGLLGLLIRPTGGARTGRRAPSDGPGAEDARQTGFRGALGSHLPEIAIGLAYLGMLAAHLIPRTAASFYNALQAPLLWILAAAALARLGLILRERGPAVPRAAVAVFVAGLAANAGLQFAATQRDFLLLLPLRSQANLVRQVSAYLDAALPPGTPLLTFSPQFALDTRLIVAPGFEMSVFGYQPTWPAEKARAYKVLNNDLLLEAFGREDGAIVLSDFDFEHILYGDPDAFKAAIYRSHRLAAIFPYAGTISDNLYVFLPPATRPPASMTPLAVQLEGGIRLLGYEIEAGPHRAGDPVRFALYWQAAGTPGRDYTVFTHLLNGEDQSVAGWDNPPCRRTCPTDRWRPGEVVRDEYALPGDASRLAGEYRIEVGMYEPDTGRRLKIVADDGRAAGDSIQLPPLALR